MPTNNTPYSWLTGSKAALLQNHGLLTTGGTVEETVFWFLSLDRCCHSQLLADAAAAGTGGATKKIGDKEAIDTYIPLLFLLSLIWS